MNVIFKFNYLHKLRDGSPRVWSGRTVERKPRGRDYGDAAAAGHPQRTTMTGILE